MSTERIEWSGDWVRNVGAVNGVHCFTIVRITGHTVAGYPFKIQHELPGYKQFSKAFATTEGCKTVCERVLTAFMDRMGFVPKEEDK